MPAAFEQNMYHTTNAVDKRSIPKHNDKRNRVAFDYGNRVPVHSAQQYLIKGVHVQNFNSTNMRPLRKISILASF